MKPQLNLGPISLLIAIAAPTWTAAQVTKTGDTVVDPKALTIQGSFGQGINGLSFQQDALATHRGFQYVGYYDGQRRVCLARRKLPAGDWGIIRFADYDFKSNDAHNVISLGICPQDGTIHLAFDHHGHPLHYRASRRGVASDPESVAWEASLFGPILSELEPGRPIKITYPRFWQTPDGGLQFCYRRGGSGDGDRMLVDYDPQSGRWVDTRQIDSGRGTFADAMGESQSRCSYPNGYDYGPDGRLHATWVWRESSQGSNHDLVYSYSDDAGKTWFNNRGQSLAEPPNVNSPGIKVVDISRAHGLMNTHGQAVDSQGRVHVVMWHSTDESLAAAGSRPGEHRWGPPEARRYHHYWRDGCGDWQHRELPWVAGDRPKLFIDKGDNIYLIHAVRYEPAEVEGGVALSTDDLVIAAATARSNWSNWKIVHVEKGPFLREMLGDRYRWKSEGTLSVMVQEVPEEPHQATRLRILDFSAKRK
jgi:hypothetical protein